MVAPKMQLPLRFTCFNMLWLMFTYTNIIYINIHKYIHLYCIYIHICSYFVVTLGLLYPLGAHVPQEPLLCTGSGPKSSIDENGILFVSIALHNTSNVVRIISSPVLLVLHKRWLLL